MIKKAITLLVLLVALSVACKKDKEPESTSYDQGSLLDNWADNVIVPSYKNYAESTEKLRLEILKIKENSDLKDLFDVKLLHREVCLNWQKVSFYEFGPAADIVLRANTNTYPCDTSEIESKIQSSNLDLKKASDLSKKGLAAMDYLLYNPRIQVLDKKRLDYLIAISSELASNASSVHQSWTSTYSSTFKSTKGNSAGSSVSLMVNAMSLHLERYLRDGKIAIPAGLRSFSGTPLPSRIESTYQAGGFSSELLKANFKQLTDIYRGTDASTGAEGIGLDDYLVSIGAKTGTSSLDQAIESQFSVIDKSLNNLPSDFNSDVVSQKDKFEGSFKELQKLILFLKADIPASLGVLISYQDSDGD